MRVCTCIRVCMCESVCVHGCSHVYERRSRERVRERREWRASACSYPPTLYFEGSMTNCMLPFVSEKTGVVMAMLSLRSLPPNRYCANLPKAPEPKPVYGVCMCVCVCG